MALNVNLDKKTFNSLKTKNKEGDVLSQIKVYKGFDVDKNLKGLSYIKVIYSGSWLACHLYNPMTTDCYISVNRANVVNSVKMLIDKLIEGVDNGSFKQIKSADNVGYKRLVKIKAFIKTLK